MITQTLHIQGMTCQGCANSIIKATTALQGIQNVNICLQNKTAIVEFDEMIINLQTIVETIENTGFDIVP